MQSLFDNCVFHLSNRMREKSGPSKSSQKSLMLDEEVLVEQHSAVMFSGF